MTPTIRFILKLIGYLGLALSIIPAVLVFRETVSTGTYYRLLVLGMLLWFCTAVFWIKADHLSD